MASYPASVLEPLKVDEGFRGRPYTDTVGKVTIGYGRNLDDNPMTPAEATVLLQNDLDAAAQALDRALPFWRSFNEARQGVLLNMTYNLGIQGVLGFPKMIAALKAGDFTTAASEMLDSLWAQQVKGRATRLAQEMRTGVQA